MAEALLPGTDAITKGEIEWKDRRGGYLVRYRQLDGVVRRCATKDWNEANEFWERAIVHLRKCVEARKGKGQSEF